MADTVEEVYVWSGSDWVPVVRDECTLPIESVDGTVVVDGASSVFTVSTGEEERIIANDDGDAALELGLSAKIFTADLERLKVDEGGRLGVTRTSTDLGTMYGLIDARTNNAKTLQEQMATSGSLLHRESCSYSIRNEAKADGSYGAFVFRVTNSKNVNQMAGFAVEATADSTTPNMVWVVKKTTSSSKIQMMLDHDGNLQLPQGRFEASSITGLADNDAEILLGSQATLSAGDGSEYVPNEAASIATKKTVDEKIWVGTTEEYSKIDPSEIKPTTLYCLTD